MANRKVEKIMIYGDLHLSDVNYGKHLDYAKESLTALQNVTKYAEENKITCIIGLGDLFDRKIANLEYRLGIDAELRKQCELTKGKRYEIVGNHDFRTTDKVMELEYYKRNGLIKENEILQYDTCNISMVDYGKIEKTDVKIEEGKTNIILTHDFLSFAKDSSYIFNGRIELDNFEKYKGANEIICGHIHAPSMSEGKICGEKARLCFCGSPTRKQYDTSIYEEVYVAIVEIGTEKTTVKYETIKLPKIEEVFDLSLMEDNDEKKSNNNAMREAIRNIGNIKLGEEDIPLLLESSELASFPDKVKSIALEWLKLADG